MTGQRADLTPWKPGKNHLSHEDVIPVIRDHVGYLPPNPGRVSAITRHLQGCLHDSTVVVDELLKRLTA